LKPSAWTVAWVLVSACGCDGPGAGAGLPLAQRLQHEDPDVRLRAVWEAGERKAPEAVPFLVDRLSDSEVDVRVFAAVALEKATGRRMGYCAYDPPDRRAEAIRRWRDWLEAGRPAEPATRPAETTAP